MFVLNWIQQIILRLVGCKFITYPIDDETVAVKWTCG